MKRQILTAFSVLLLLSAAVAAVWMRTDAGAPVSSVAAENFGGAFDMVDQDNKPVSDHDFAGTWRLIYFGFTYCPAICPTELAKMTRALKALGGHAGQIRPIFISVDPERDTPSVIKKYLTSFYPGFTGLTGTIEQVKKIKSAYKVYAAKVKQEGTTDYTVDHSSFIYLMDPSDNLQALYKISDTSETITADISVRLKSYKD